VSLLKNRNDFEVAIINQNLLDRETDHSVTDQFNDLVTCPRIFIASSRNRWRASLLKDSQEALVISRPIKYKELFDILLTAVKGGASPTILPSGADQSRSTSKSGIARKAKSARILLVEDNLINQKVASALLKKLGHQVFIVTDGQSALNELERQAFDLVFMDVQMPGMDGLTATAKIRRELNLPNLPIVAMTAHSMKGDKERCLVAGMNDYLSKPIDPDELHQIIQKWIGLKHSNKPELAAIDSD
jgi:two-component system sensor histidine kinase/response regulator